MTTHIYVREDVAGLTDREIRMKVAVLRAEHPDAEMLLDLEDQAILWRPSA